MGGGLTWVEYEVTFTADKDRAIEAFRFFDSLDHSVYDYTVGDFEYLKGKEDGTWFITYGADSYEEGPVRELNRQFPDLNATVRVCREQYD